MVNILSDCLNGAFSRGENDFQNDGTIPPDTSGADLLRERVCARCGQTYVATFPGFLVSSARKKGGSPFWTFFVKAPGKCEQCEKLEKDEEARAACLRSRGSRDQREIQWQKICPPLFKDTDLALLPQSVRGSADRVVKWTYGPQGLLIPGVTGKGKTRAVWLLLKRLYVDEGRALRVFDCVQFNHECNEMALQNDRFAAWAEGLVKTDVVFFDDFGKGRFSDRVESEFFAIVDRRMVAKKPVIITTNDNGETLMERMSEDRGAPLIRRLKESCHVIPFR